MAEPVVIGNATLYLGDCVEVLRTLPDASVQCCVTSPPYFGLRDYGHDGQIGLEPTPDEYVASLVGVFREVRRVLADDGCCWINLGDSYCSTAPGTKNAPQTKGSTTKPEQWANLRPKTPRGLKPKDLIGIPWRVAFALQADGWYLRQDIIWHKLNPIPESVKDRCTKAHEYLFLLTKQARYYWDAETMQEKGSPPRKPGVSCAENYSVLSGRKDGSQRLGGAGFGANGTRNRRSVWAISPKPFKGAHFAVMPEALVEPCILAGSRPGDTILDPFVGSGTVGAVAACTARFFVGIDLNAEYLNIAAERIENAQRQGRLF